MEAELLYELFLPLSKGAAEKKGESITKTDFYICGLTGAENASARRDALCLSLSLPVGMGATPLLSALNLLLSKEEFYEKAEALFGDLS